MTRLIKRLLASGVLGAVALALTTGTAHAGIGMNHNETLTGAGGAAS